MSLSRACIGVIDRYQASRVAHVADGRCRFDPSCSTYLREAFTTRTFAVAWLLSAWRIIRCNPLTRARSVDPVARAHRGRPRPNALRTAFASMLLAGVVTMLIGGTAGAQSLQGPCTGMINGRAPASLTKGNPLVVRPGENVTVNGTLQGAKADTPSVTNIQVDIISGLLSAKEIREGTGPAWGGSVNVDAYLKKGSGLYRVHGTASAPGISCRGDGYVKLDGAGLIAAVSAGVGVVGLTGSVLAPGLPRSDLDASAFRSEVMPAEQAVTYRPYRSGLGGCCLVTLLSIPLLMVGMAGDGGAGAAGDAAASASGRKVWKRGHTVLGFFSGLLFGLGGTVFLQQQAVWILDIWTAIVLPLGLAILVAVRARIGRPYLVEHRTA